MKKQSKSPKSRRQLRRQILKAQKRVMKQSPKLQRQILKLKEVMTQNPHTKKSLTLSQKLRSLWRNLRQAPGLDR